MPTTLTRTATTDMEVTSIRLERDLKEKLKDLSTNQGYQALIRDILWNYVNQRSQEPMIAIEGSEIRARLAATGKSIKTGDAMFLGLTTTGSLVPLSSGSLI
jgi:hypothetical protein